MTTHSFPDADRVAVMGGAYGNVPALEACLDDAAAQESEVHAFLGDAIGCCGHSDETIILIRTHFDVLVAGNHEKQAAAGADTCACGYASEEDERIACKAFERALESLNEDHRHWLGTWPDLTVLETAVGRLLLCHGSPEQTNEFLYASQVDEDRLTRWLDAHEAMGMICTHTGLPWTRHLPGGRFAANCGVVGKPDHDGDPAVHYALVRAEASQPQVEIRRVSYDHERWADTLAEEGVDPIFVEPLRTGRWTTGINSLPSAERDRPRRG